MITKIRKQQYNKKYYQQHCEKIKKRRKAYRQQHPHKIKEDEKDYRQTLNGHLRNLRCDMNRRCNNPKDSHYKDYGGRGIECLFTSDEFVDYVINDLGYDTYDKIKGLQIDRIDNNGHYEKDNIRFVTAKENCNNRRKAQR